MKAEIGIPDDSPENTVKAIKAIAQGVADELGGTCTLREEFGRLSTKLDIDIFVEGSHLRIRLSYVDSQNLPCMGSSGSIGSGDIWPGVTELSQNVGEHWKLELICYEPGASPPFLWGLYPSDVSNPLGTKPSRILDGPVLRHLIRARLQPLPPELP